MNSSQYRRSLFLGSTPPHQATLFGPGSRSKLAYYSAGFRLSADLDYFLKLSRHHDLLVQCLDLELVHMADGGAVRNINAVFMKYSVLIGTLSLGFGGFLFNTLPPASSFIVVLTSMNIHLFASTPRVALYDLLPENLVGYTRNPSSSDWLQYADLNDPSDSPPAVIFLHRPFGLVLLPFGCLHLS